MNGFNWVLWINLFSYAVLLFLWRATARFAILEWVNSLFDRTRPITFRWITEERKKTTWENHTQVGYTLLCFCYVSYAHENFSTLPWYIRIWFSGFSKSSVALHQIKALNSLAFAHGKSDVNIAITIGYDLLDRVSSLPDIRTALGNVLLEQGLSFKNIADRKLALANFDRLYICCDPIGVQIKMLSELQQSVSDDTKEAKLNSIRKTLINETRYPPHVAWNIFCHEAKDWDPSPEFLESCFAEHWRAAEKKAALVV